MDPFLRALSKATTPQHKALRTQGAQTPQSFNPNAKLSEAALEKIEERDRQFRKYEDEQERKKVKLLQESPPLVAFLAALSRNDKTTTAVEGGILDTDFTEKAIECGLRQEPEPVRRLALAEFHNFIIKKNRRAGFPGLDGPMPWDEQSDLQVMKTLLRLK